MSEEREQYKEALEQLKAWAALSGAPGDTVAGKLRELFVSIASYVESLEAERDELKRELSAARNERDCSRVGFYAARSSLITSEFYLLKLKELAPDRVGRWIDEAHEEVERRSKLEGQEG